ncbi:hypothetical protein SNEBB_010881 [Seison nebaliae]|nr:hypothetical protein SNEBB_010881 [Seison nebaliae]
MFVVLLPLTYCDNNIPEGFEFPWKFIEEYYVHKSTGIRPVHRKVAGFFTGMMGKLKKNPNPPTVLTWQDFVELSLKLEVPLNLLHGLLENIERVPLGTGVPRSTQMALRDAAFSAYNYEKRKYYTEVKYPLNKKQDNNRASDTTKKNKIMTLTIKMDRESMSRQTLRERKAYDDKLNQIRREKLKRIEPRKPQNVLPKKPQYVPKKKPQYVPQKKPQIIEPKKSQIIEPKKPQIIEPKKPQIITPKKSQIITPKIPEPLAEVSKFTTDIDQTKNGGDGSGDAPLNEKIEPVEYETFRMRSSENHVYATVEQLGADVSDNLITMTAKEKSIVDRLNCKGKMRQPKVNEIVRDLIELLKEGVHKLIIPFTKYKITNDLSEIRRDNWARHRTNPLSEDNHRKILLYPEVQGEYDFFESLGSIITDEVETEAAYLEPVSGEFNKRLGNTFILPPFYSRATNEGAAKIATELVEAMQYHTPRDHWEKNMEVFLFPICHNQHWRLMVYHVRTKKTYVLDSIDSTSHSPVHIIIKTAYKELMNGDLNLKRITQLKVCQQRDGWSCGRYVYGNMRALAARVQTTFSHDDLAQGMILQGTSSSLGKFIDIRIPTNTPLCD